jgi:hypothetical protein
MAEAELEDEIAELYALLGETSEALMSSPRSQRKPLEEKAPP